MDKTIYFDGQDWIHLSDNCCLVYHERIENFESYCFAHINLFTKEYTPKYGDTIIDAGSGIGAELAIFSKMVGDNGHVYAIEADPNLYNKNLKVTELMNLKNVTCINAALVNNEESVSLGIVSENGIDSSIFIKNPNKTITVEGISFDKIFEKYNINNVDYVKINIEGSEKYALQGISNIQKIKNWCISTHDFCGIKTKNFVVNFFNSRGILVKIHEEVEIEPWKGGYVYVKQ